MPRFRVPNASPIASADLPILPFLAPRVFAHTSTPSGTRQYHARTGTSQDKEKGTSNCLGETTKSQYQGGIAENRQAVGTTCRKLPSSEAPAAGLLQTSGYWRKATDGPASVNRLYADISTFTRQYARSYATSISSKQDTVGDKLPSRPRARRAQPTRTRPPSTLPQNTLWRTHKRSRLLSLELARLRNYVSRQRAGFPGKRLGHLGQFRSLRRRVTNLVRWGTTHVALTAKFTRLSGLQFAFAALERRLYAAFRKRARRVTFKHDLRCARLSWFLFATGASPSPQKLWYRWVKLDISTRKAYVHRLLIYFLDRKPGRALRFIQVLANDPLLRGRKQEAIADALSHLSALHRQGVYEGSSWGTDIEAHKREFVPIFLRIFVKTLSGQRDICSEDLLYGLTQLAKTEDLKKVFDCLVERKVHLTFDTLLHYAQTFGEAGEVEYALKCLETLKKRHLARTWEDVVQRKRLRWTCAVILRRSMTTTKDFYHTPYIVAAFVRLGIQMDLLLYNVVIHNAMEAGDHATAFKVYNTFEENKLQPDKYTFGIMLHGCTMQDDPAYFQSFAQYCEEVAQDIRDPWLATDCLYYVYVRHRLDRDADKISALIWQSYARLFSAAPLQSFVDHGTPSLRNAVMSQDPSTRENTHLPPPATALYIMLQTEIQSALAISNMRVYNLYLKFKSVAEEGGTPEFDELVKRPIIWNAFLYAFCQKQQFATASQLIQDMTNGPAKPNVYSWNIFMQAFFKEGQVQAAERIFEIMRDRGVDPDQYTWGVMLRGYAKAQQIDRIDETLPHLEPENESDPGILAFLAKVVDRRKLMNVLEKNRLNKEATAQERAEQEAEAERSWWHDELANVEADSTTTEDATSTHLGATGSYVLGTSVQPTKEQSNLADIRAVTRNGTTSLPSGATDSSVLEDDIPSIGERSRLLQDRASYLPTSKEPPRMPSSRPRIRRANPQDPEVQYRKLQERLGLVEPTAPTVEDRAELKAARKSRAGPVFKSMINRARNMPKGGDDVE